MRILMIGDHVGRMMDEVCRNSASIERVHSTSALVIFKDGSEIHVRPMKNRHDSERVRGQRFDLVVEHGSFRGPYELIELVRMTVLRP